MIITDRLTVEKMALDASLNIFFPNDLPTDFNKFIEIKRCTSFVCAITIILDKVDNSTCDKLYKELSEIPIMERASVVFIDVLTAKPTYEYDELIYDALTSYPYKNYVDTIFASHCLDSLKPSQVKLNIMVGVAHEYNQTLEDKTIERQVHKQLYEPDHLLLRYLDDVEEQVFKTVAMMLNVSEDQITRELNFTTDLCASSIDFSYLIEYINFYFYVSIPHRIELDTVGQLVDYIKLATLTLYKAKKIAYEAHHGQVDKLGVDYIEHPLRVMNAGYDEDEKVVGILHDVVEDSHWTFEMLEEEGFPVEIIDALICVTKLSEDEPYDDFIDRVLTNETAMEVKLNDLADNMDLRRLPEITDRDIERIKKYHKAYVRIMNNRNGCCCNFDFMKKKKVYIDMDNVLVDFPTGIAQLDAETIKKYEGHLDDVPHIFAKMKPVKGAIEAFNLLAKQYDIYILSTAPWDNPSAWSDKLEWVKLHLGEVAYKRLILSHHKNLCSGDYLIDDRDKNGAGEFDGELIRFGSDRFPDWQSVVEYLTKD